MRFSRNLWRVALGAALAVGATIALASAASAADVYSPTNNGPTPPALADPVSGNVAPHGGYSSSTGYCLQCHSVHLGGEYALMAANSVKAVCNTCHTIGATAQTGRIDPNLPGQTLGSAATRAVYTTATGNIKSGHDPFLDGDVSGNIDGAVITQLDPLKSISSTAPKSYTTPAGPGTTGGSGGLYCNSCHSPHGDKGQTVNTAKVWTIDPSTSGSPWVAPDDEMGLKLVNWSNGTEIRYFVSPLGTGYSQLTFGWSGRSGTGTSRLTDNVASGTVGHAYIHKDSEGPWEICGKSSPTSAAGLDGSEGVTTADDVCRYAQVLDAEGQIVSLYGYKLLSSAPNHTYGSVYSAVTVDASGNTVATTTGNFVRSYNAGYEDTVGWCGTCHNPRLDSEFGTFGASAANHNHPTPCNYCHGNETTYTIGSSSSTGNVTGSDFPHTSTNSYLLKAMPDGLCLSCHTGGLP